MDKTITLNGHVRSEIIGRIMRQWRAQQVRHKDGVHHIDLSPADLKAREEDRKREQQYRHQLSLALGTFKTVNALVKEWPEIEGYVPKVLTAPREVITLPELPA